MSIKTLIENHNSYRYDSCCDRLFSNACSLLRYDELACSQFFSEHTVVGTERKVFFTILGPLLPND